MDAELLGRIRHALNSADAEEDPVFLIAAEVTDYFEEFIEELEDSTASERCMVTSLPILLEDGSMLETAITIQRFTSPDGEAGFGLKIAGSTDQAQVIGLLELAKMSVLTDDD